MITSLVCHDFRARMKCYLILPWYQIRISFSSVLVVSLESFIYSVCHNFHTVLKIKRAYNFSKQQFIKWNTSATLLFGLLQNLIIWGYWSACLFTYFCVYSSSNCQNIWLNGGSCGLWWQNYYLFKVLMRSCRIRLLSTTIFREYPFSSFSPRNVFFEKVSCNV